VQDIENKRKKPEQTAQIKKAIQVFTDCKSNLERKIARADKRFGKFKAEIQQLFSVVGTELMQIFEGDDTEDESASLQVIDERPAKTPMIEETKRNPLEEVIKGKDVLISQLHDEIKQLQNKWSQISALTVQSLSLAQPQPTPTHQDPFDLDVQSKVREDKLSTDKSPEENQATVPNDQTSVGVRDFTLYSFDEAINLDLFDTHMK
jgi:hypothetical protein